MKRIYLCYYYRIMSLTSGTIYYNKLSKRNVSFQINSPNGRFFKYLGGDNLVYKNFTIEDQNGENYSQLYNISGTTTTDSVFNVNNEYLQYGYPFLPKGVIMIWSGSISPLPAGWVLCDGQVKTVNGFTFTPPDLRGRFVMSTTNGAISDSNDRGGTNLAMNTSGGERNHTLTISEIPAHTHGSNDNPPSLGLVQRTGSNTLTTFDASANELDLVNSAGLSIYYTGGTGSASDGTTNLNGATVPHNNMPPYYVLAYIMKGF